MPQDEDVTHREPRLQARAHPRAPHPAPTAPLPSLRHLAETAAKCRAEPGRNEQRQAEEQQHRTLHNIAAHFTATAADTLLRQAARDPTEPFTLDDLACAGMAATHTRLMKVLLAISAEHQVLAPLAGTPPRWQLTGQADASRALRDALREHPALAQQLTLYAYCGRHLPELLRGDRSPHDLLFAGADRHLAESFAAEPVSGSHLDTIAALVSSILTDWPPDRPLRILQVGARTLELTGKLLEFLPPERTEYLVTDASAGFLRRSRHRFAGHGLIEHRPFDPDLDPGGQGYANRSFDLVLAHQSLHPARDLRRTVTALAGLLIPGGLLIGVEPHDLRATVLWRGLRPDFWSFTDSELRFSSPLLSAPAWQDLLTDCGFAVAHAIGTEESSVLLARRPPAAALTAPPPPALPSGAAHWILAAERPDDPLARQLAALLTESGAASVCRTRPADKTAQWQRSWQDKRHPLHIVLLLDDTAAPKAQEPEAVTESAVHRTASLAAFARAQAGCTAGGAAPPVAALWLVARSPAALAPPGAPELAAPWAAARWLAKEHPAVAVRRIALAADPELPETARRLALELLDPTGADELLLTATGRFTVRTGPRTPPLTTGGPDRPYRPEVRRPAPSYHPSWTPAGRPAGPGPHQVLIEARALGLNPRAARRASGPALECAGTVVAVGSAVRDLAPGDRVCALGTGIPGHHALARRQLAGRIPDTMAFTEAATLPLAFLTARRALDQLARLAPGETLLLHHATGGTGLAAARLAHQRGARVIATADTPAQRDLLRLLGVDGVLDPHHPDFSKGVWELTGDQGVDVVLNSPCGETLVRDAGLLRPGGRLIRLGGRDTGDAGRLPPRLLTGNITFAALDLGQLLSGEIPPHGNELERALNEGNGQFRWPLPHRTYPAHRVRDAFRSLRRSREIGKVVLTLDPPPPVRAAPAPPAPDPAAAYLVTGGLSGPGAAIARHLAERGARHLVLTDHRGRATPGASALLAALTARGVRVAAHATDPGDPAALREVIATGPPLRGVVHAAPAPEGGPPAGLTAERLRSVLRPTLLGALQLAAATKEMPLDFFICCAPAGASLGEPGQGARAAAHLALEALVRSRRAAGLPGLVIGWEAAGKSEVCAVLDALPTADAGPATAAG